MPIQRSFAKGEIGPGLYAGAVPADYQAALATCRNFLIRRGGGIANRTGSEYIATVKDSTVKTYLMRFQYTATDTYAIEVGNEYFRFYQLGGQVTVGTPGAWSSVTAYVIGNIVASGGTNYYCILGNTNHVPPNATYWYPLTGNILEIPTPYLAADIGTLRYVQAGDVVTITHPNYPPMQLNRFATLWTLTTLSTAPAIAAPAGLAATAGSAGTLTYNYVVTAVLTGTYEESVASTANSCSCVAPIAATPNTLAWTAVANAVEYNVYLDPDGNGVFGFIGIGKTNAFNDIGFTPDYSVTPPIARTLFNSTGNYPTAASYYQQRLCMAGSLNEPAAVYASRTGAFSNFTISSPIQDDDAVTFTIASRKVSTIQHMIEVLKLLIFTSTGEWLVEGDADGVVRPTAINLQQQSYCGSSAPIPVVIGNTVVYVQARGGIVRDLRFNQTFNSYDSRDLTIYASHLFEGHSIDRIDFAQIPDSIVWCVRDDGTLLAITYLTDLDTYGWSRHDTLGAYEDVIAIPETTQPVPGSATRGKQEDAIYVIVNRTIGGVTKRYVERFASRFIEDYRLDGIFLDACLTYNGINQTAATVTLTTAAGWTPADLITVTASVGEFVLADVGNGITVWYGSALVRIMVTAYVSATVVKGNPTVAIPVALQNFATPFWSVAVGAVTGLSHLEGQTVGICANGVPLTGVVTGGSVSMPGGAVYDVIHVGLPIVADMESLDLDSAQADIRDKKKLVKSVSLLVSKTRGAVAAGPDVNHLTPYVPEIGDALQSDIFGVTSGAVRNEIIEVPVNGTWAKPGRVFVRQTDPLPITILAIMPDGTVGG